MTNEIIDFLTSQSIPIWVTMLTSVALTAAVIVNTLSVKNTKKLGNAQLLQQFHQDLENILQRENELNNNQHKNTVHDCNRFASDFCNVLERIAFLRLEKSIDKKTARFFQTYFSYGLRLLDWKKGLYKKDPFELWNYITEYCEKEKITSELYEKDIPSFMKKFENSRDRNTAI